ncbi:MAG TPA: HYR domain-containing protein [Chitinophagales bacterium]|nr:HYR domain-containing protein [Chitinophagales bacterium]
MKTRSFLFSILLAGLIFSATRIQAQLCACNCAPSIDAYVISEAEAFGCNGNINIIVSGCTIIGGDLTVHRTDAGNTFPDIEDNGAAFNYDVPAGHYHISWTGAGANFCSCFPPPPPPVGIELNADLTVTQPACNLDFTWGSSGASNGTATDGGLVVNVTGNTCDGGFVEVINSQGFESLKYVSDNSQAQFDSLAAGNYIIQYSYYNYDVSNDPLCLTYQSASVPSCPVGFNNCPNSFSVPNDFHKCSAYVTWDEPIPFSACGPAQIFSQNYYPDDTFEVGTYHVHYISQDNYGHRGYCDFDFEVVDLEGPVIDGPAQIDEVADVDSDGVWECGASVDFEDQFTAIDYCGGEVEKSFSIESGSFFEKGITTVVLTATDSHGNTSSRNFNVNVIDITPPTLIVNPDVFKANYHGLCKASINYDDILIIEASDNCYGVAVTYDFESGHFFTDGSVVHVTATDASGLQTTRAVTIHVIDNEPPVLTFCPADIHVNNDPGNPGPCGAIVNYFLPTATDNCTNPLPPPVLTFGLPSGALFPVGVTFVTYRFTDAAGNGTNCVFSVTVDDVDPPIITVTNIIVPNDPGLCSAFVVGAAPVAIDNCPGFGPVVGPAPLGVFPVGTTPLNYTCTDASGNVGFATMYITVLDIEKPHFINCPSNIITNNPVVSWTEPTASDNCNDTVTRNHYPGEVFLPGTTQVTYIAVDPSGNRDTCKFNVTVTSNCVATITPSGNVTICSGSNLTMQANTGTGLTYQWKKNGNNISGVTSSSYTTNKAASYTVVVTTSTGCTATSAATVVTVSSAPSATITPSGTVTVCPGVAVTFQANTGTGLTYQWMNSSGNIGGANGSSYTTSAKSTYKVTVTNASGCSKTSMGTKLQNYPAASVKITYSGSLNICSTGSVTLNAKIVSGYTYQWYKDYLMVAGATGSSYAATSAGSYSYIATTTNGCTAVSLSKTVTGCRLDEASANSPGAPSLNLYPNPSDGTFMLEVQLNDDYNGNASVEIMNSIGQIIQQEVAVVNDGVFAHTIHLENNVPAGMYFIKVMTNDKILKSQIMIKR